MASACLPYASRNVAHDFFPLPSFLKGKEQIVRITKAVLPFFFLYQPFSYPLSLAMGATRCITTGKTLWESKNKTFPLMHTAGAIAGLAGTYFRHPLGMLIASIQDIFLDLTRFKQHLEEQNQWLALVELFHVANDSLYAALFLKNGIEIAITSLSVQFLLHLYHSYTHFQAQGQTLEATCSLLMGLIRGHQAIRTLQQGLIEKEIQKAQQEGRLYLPLANPVQKFFTNLGYRVNTLARFTIRQLSLIFSPLPEERYVTELATRIGRGVLTTLALPLTLSAFAISTPSYFLASYTGIGRFERIESISAPSSSLQKDKISVMFQNICGQNPWSVFTGKYPPPLEQDSNGETRANQILSSILKENPDFFLGQEFDDLDTSKFIGQALAQRRYVCFRDMGCPDPIKNPSGLFLALEQRSAADSTIFYPFLEQHKTGVTSWTDRGITTTTVSFPHGKPLGIINLHLNSGDNPENHLSRLQQLKYYVTPLMNKEEAVIAIGDSNINTARLSESDKEFSGLNGITNALEGQETCNDGKVKECIDVILHNDKVEISDVRLIPGNSDHVGVSFKVSLRNSPSS